MLNITLACKTIEESNCSISELSAALNISERDFLACLLDEGFFGTDIIIIKDMLNISEEQAKMIFQGNN